MQTGGLADEDVKLLREEAQRNNRMAQ